MKTVTSLITMMPCERTFQPVLFVSRRGTICLFVKFAPLEIIYYSEVYNCGIKQFLPGILAKKEFHQMYFWNKKSKCLSYNSFLSSCVP